MIVYLVWKMHPDHTGSVQFHTLGGEQVNHSGLFLETQATNVFNHIFVACSVFTRQG